jgi:hypothetical protein
VPGPAGEGVAAERTSDWVVASVVSYASQSKRFKQSSSDDAELLAVCWPTPIKSLWGAG